MRGGAVVPLTTQGRLAPAGLVPELALGALRAIKSELGRLVIGQVGRKAIILIRPPHAATLNTTNDDGKALGLHTLSLRRPICSGGRR